MKHLFFLLFIAFSLSASAQSPFKHIPPPAKTYGVILGASNEITAYRFTAPTAGTAFYADGEIKVITGLGFGLQRLHFVDSTQRYYADFSFKATVFAGGNVTPSFKDNNVMGIGLMVGFLNELLNAGFIYNIPMGVTKGKFGLVFSFGIPLN